MKEILINLETAKLSKKEGFDYPTLFYHITNKGKYMCDDKIKGYSGSSIPETNWNQERKAPYIEDMVFYSAPTQSLLQKWLREVRNIFVEILMDKTTTPKFAVEIWEYSHFGNYKQIIQKKWYLYRTYEEALESGLQEALEELISKNNE